MSAAPILLARRAIVSHLRADFAVTALISAGSIFGERAEAEATWPFIRLGEFEGANLGQQIRASIHVFSKSAFTDEANEIIEAVGESLDSAALMLEDYATASVEVVRTRMLPDPAEQSAWHGIAEILMTVPRDCELP